MLRLLFLLLPSLLLAASAAAEPPPAESSEARLCRLITSAAEARGLPVGFFTRLLWKESSFRGEAVSPKGAQGIAQFMPGTAAERGLVDPFDIETAIPASAHLLADLKARFGNLGLAAAAYNAGAQRVADWLDDLGSLPWETQDYVLSITGLSAEAWTSVPPPSPPASENDCLKLTALLKVPDSSLSPGIETATGPWGVQVAGNFSKARAIAAYRALQERYSAVLSGQPPMIVSGRLRGRGTRAFYRIRVPAQSRQEADRLCARLQQAGAACIVLKT
jgi:hypothetical protein